MIILECCKQALKTMLIQKKVDSGNELFDELKCQTLNLTQVLIFSDSAYLTH
jgi:hypothetical protein